MPTRQGVSRRAQSLFVVLVVFLFSVTTSYGKQCQDGLVLQGDVDGLNPSMHLLHLEDTTRSLAITQVIDRDDFSRLEGASANFGLTTSYHWLKLKLCNTAAQPQVIYLEMLNTLVETMDYYVIADSQVVFEQRHSIKSPHDVRNIKSRLLLLPLSMEAKSDYTVYIRMSSEGINLIDMSVRLWETNHLIEHTQNVNILWGMFYGGLLIIILYNLFIYVTVQDKAYLYYVLYQFSMLLAWMATAGHGAVLLWPESVFLKNSGAMIFTGVTAVFSAQFCRHFLRTREGYKHYDRVLLLGVLFGVALILATLFSWTFLSNMMIWSISLIPVLYLYIGWQVYRSGYRPARFFLLAYVFVLIGTAIFGLLGTGIVEYTTLIELAGPAGVWIEAALLSFALADRIRSLQTARGVAETRLVQAQIEPHFLFNTLANISSLMESDVQRAKKMVMEFSSYLRTSLDRTRDERTTLGQEITLLKAYLNIMETRMGDRFTYTIDVSPSLYSFEFAPLLLQPLVENAIKHGLDPNHRHGFVHISGHIYDSVLSLEVRDNGVGLSDTLISGTGINNVRERLRLIYGSKARLEISQHPEGGVVCKILVSV